MMLYLIILNLRLSRSFDPRLWPMIQQNHGFLQDSGSLLMMMTSFTLRLSEVRKIGLNPGRELVEPRLGSFGALFRRERAFQNDRATRRNSGCREGSLP